MKKLFTFNNKGFSLIESLVAVGLLSVSYVSLLSYQTFAINSAEESEKLTLAVMLAREKMSEAELEFRNAPFTEIKKEDGGTFEDFPDYSWTRQVEEFTINLPIPKNEDEAGQSQNLIDFAQKFSQVLSEHIMKVTLTVKYKVRGNVREKQVITIIVDLSKDITLGDLT